MWCQGASGGRGGRPGNKKEWAKSVKSADKSGGKGPWEGSRMGVSNLAGNREEVNGRPDPMSGGQEEIDQRAVPS